MSLANHMRQLYAQLQMTAKQRAAEAAMSYIASGMRIGLGTGSTTDFFLLALAAALRAGKLNQVVGVPTSVQSENRARELGIPLSTLAETGMLDVTVDGADEIAPNLDLIKGLGGALLREKVVAQNSRQLIIIADIGKRVAVLGERAALPVEVAQFAHQTQVAFFRSLGCEPKLRLTQTGKPYITDNGSLIYDCKFPRIDDPRSLQATLKSRAGVVETGLFLDLASRALIADADHVEEISH